MSKRAFGYTIAICIAAVACQLIWRHEPMGYRLGMTGLFCFGFFIDEVVKGCILAARYFKRILRG